MVDIVDSDKPASSADKGCVAGGDSIDIDDDVTAEVLGKSAAPAGDEPATNDDLAGGDLAGDCDPAGEDSRPSQKLEDDTLDAGFILRDRFEIVSLVHTGGMGHVYKALDKRRHRDASDEIHVAIKIMRRSVSPQLDVHLALEREAAKTQRLSHPNVVSIFDFDQHDDQFYLVMEWLEGESVNALFRRTSNKPLSTQFAFRLIQGIAAGLQHAHSNNVVHADVNPSNVFITDTQEIKLLDFGVARNTADPEDGTENRITWATHSYASPEVLEGLPPTFEDDIFSLGCVAYRALTGKHPFGGCSSTEAKQIQAKLQPVPGLADSHWQVIKAALSYAHPNRPLASAFFFDQPASNGFVPADEGRRRGQYQWLPTLVAASIVVLAGSWWVTQRDTPDVAGTIPEEEIASADAEMETERSEVDVLLRNATQAMEALQFIAPEDTNARVFFRDALVLDPENSTALSGLRKISDTFVQQAETALRIGDPAKAIVALGVAADTDPGNPAITIVNELLLVQANAELAKVRVAIAEGNPDRATELLSQVERYALIGADEIDSVKSRISDSEREREFINTLAAADADTAAGRLIAPIGNNAHTSLIELLRTHGADPRVVASAERLGQRLLSRATFATAVEQFPEATEALVAAASLGVLVPEVTAAQEWLDLAMTESTSSTNVALTTEEVVQERLVAPPQNALAGGEEGQPTDSAMSGPSILTSEINSEPELPGTNFAGSVAIVADDQPAQRIYQFSDLTIEKYVAPEYPRSATEREVTGAVDIQFSVNTDGSIGDIEIIHSEPRNTFVSSARNAVRQWRFAPSDDVIRARVRLRFELEGER